MTDSTDWKARAEREAAAIYDELSISPWKITRENLIGLMAAAWLQGVNLGMHETLAHAEQAFERMRAEL